MNNATCSIEGCTDPVKVKSRGWCSTHYQRWRKHGDPLADHRAKQVRECRVEGCASEANTPGAGLGLCHAHYYRQKTYGDPLGKPEPKPDVCVIAGCEGRTVGRGWCRTHWQRWRTYGNPLGRDAAKREASADRWLPAPGYEETYEVSDSGLVYNKVAAKYLKLSPNRDGYLRPVLYKDGKGRSHGVHVLVLTAFTEPRPEGYETRHLDGNPANNRLENLAWGTSLENTQDRYRHGTHPALSPPDSCPQNHVYDEENTYVHPVTGHRTCRTCRRLGQRKRKQQERLTAA